MAWQQVSPDGERRPELYASRAEALEALDQADVDANWDVVEVQGTHEKPYGKSKHWYFR